MTPPKEGVHPLLARALGSLPASKVLDVPLRHLWRCARSRTSPGDEAAAA